MGFKGFLASLLLIIGGIILALSVALAISLGLGWLLTTFLPLTLFEGTVLIILVVGATVYVARAIGQLLIGSPFDESFDESEDTDWPISTKRFQRGSDKDTGRAWAHFTVANQLALAMEDQPEIVPNMSIVQQHELAVRLADSAVSVLERLNPTSRQYRISINALKREANRRGLKPYDRELLQMTTHVVNSSLRENELLYLMIEEQGWGDEYRL